MSQQFNQIRAWLDKYNVRVPALHKLNLQGLPFPRQDVYDLISHCLSEPSEIVMARPARDGSRNFQFYRALRQPVGGAAYIMVEVRYSRDPSTGMVMARFQRQPLLVERVRVSKSSTRWHENEPENTPQQIATEAVRRLTGSEPEAGVVERWQSGQQLEEALRLMLDPTSQQQLPDAKAPGDRIEESYAPGSSLTAPPPTQSGTPQVADTSDAGASPAWRFQSVTSPLLGEIRLYRHTWFESQDAFGLDGEVLEVILKMLSRIKNPRQVYGPDRYGRTDYLFTDSRGELRTQVIVRHRAGVPPSSVVAIIISPSGKEALSGIRDRRGIPVSWSAESWNDHIGRHREISRLYVLDHYLTRRGEPGIIQGIFDKPGMIIRNKEREREIGPRERRKAGICFELTSAPDTVPSLSGDKREKRPLRIFLEYSWHKERGNCANIRSIHYWSGRWEARVKGDNQVWLLA